MVSKDLFNADKWDSVGEIIDDNKTEFNVKRVENPDIRGAYSLVYYYDENGEPCTEQNAKKTVIRSFDENGEFNSETYVSLDTNGINLHQTSERIIDLCDPEKWSFDINENKPENDNENEPVNDNENNTENENEIVSFEIIYNNRVLIEYKKNENTLSLTKYIKGVEKGYLYSIFQSKQYVLSQVQARQLCDILADYNNTTLNSAKKNQLTIFNSLNIKLGFLNGSFDSVSTFEYGENYLAGEFIVKLDSFINDYYQNEIYGLSSEDIICPKCHQRIEGFNNLFDLTGFDSLVCEQCNYDLIKKDYVVLPLKNEDENNQRLKQLKKSRVLIIVLLVIMLLMNVVLGFFVPQSLIITLPVAFSFLLLLIDNNKKINKFKNDVSNE